MRTLRPRQSVRTTVSADKPRRSKKHGPHVQGYDIRPLVRRLHERRVAAGLSLGKMGIASGMSKSYVSKLERGKLLDIQLGTLHKFARALGTTVVDLLREDDEARARLELTKPPPTPDPVSPSAETPDPVSTSDPLADRAATI